MTEAYDTNSPSPNHLLGATIRQETMTKQQQAESAAVEACRDLYDPDNGFMRSVAAIIAMTAIENYQREMNRLRKAS